jgi:hypothetical protein
MKKRIYVKEIKSSVINTVFWISENNKEILKIHFNTGSIWEYENVPLTLFFKLIRSKSPGKYFNENIRNIYHGHKVESVLV